MRMIAPSGASQLEQVKLAVFVDRVPRFGQQLAVVILKVEILHLIRSATNLNGQLDTVAAKLSLMQQASSRQRADERCGGKAATHAESICGARLVVILDEAN